MNDEEIESIPHDLSTCAKTISDMIVEMVSEGMKDLPNEEQAQRLSACCASLSEKQYTPTSAFELAPPARVDKADHGLS